MSRTAHLKGARRGLARRPLPLRAVVSRRASRWGQAFTPSSLCCPLPRLHCHASTVSKSVAARTCACCRPRLPRCGQSPLRGGLTGRGAGKAAVRNARCRRGYTHTGVSCRLGVLLTAPHGLVRHVPLSPIFPANWY